MRKYLRQNRVTARKTLSLMLVRSLGESTLMWWFLNRVKVDVFCRSIWAIFTHAHFIRKTVLVKSLVQELWGFLKECLGFSRCKISAVKKIQWSLQSFSCGFICFTWSNAEEITFLVTLPSASFVEDFFNKCLLGFLVNAFLPIWTSFIIRALQI